MFSFKIRLLVSLYKSAKYTIQIKIVSMSDNNNLENVQDLKESEIGRKESGPGPEASKQASKESEEETPKAPSWPRVCAPRVSKDSKGPCELSSVPDLFESTDFACVDKSTIVNWNDEDLYVAWNVFDPLKKRVSIILVTVEKAEIFEYICDELPENDEKIRKEFEHEHMLIKTYSECEGVIEALLKAKVIENPEKKFIRNEYNMLAKCKILLEVPSTEKVLKEIAQNKDKKYN